MIKAVFWDNDGVLVDTERLYFEATRRILSGIGVELTTDQYIDLFLVDGRGAWHLAEAAGVAPGDIERLRAARNALYADFLRSGPPLMPGVADALAALHRRYTMGVVTSSLRDHFDLIHRQTGVLEYFDFVLASGDYARSKPDPAPYLRAIERTGLEPDECVAIEDSERGLEAATRAGIRCIVVPSGLTRAHSFAGAHRIVASAAEIPAIVAGATRWQV
jgi:HAD superfamily hydrolase (TIGR01509 family)